MTRALCTVLFVLALFNGAAWAERLAVVDVERIFRESAPGMAGEAHLKQAQDILQKGLEELRALYKGKEHTAEAEAALREGHAALERQLAVERIAVRRVLAATLENVIRVWFTVHAKASAISAVATASSLIIYNPALDITEAVMREMNKEQPSFHALPVVTVKTNPQAAPGKGGAAAPARQPGR
jgi:outer membrane protein